MIRDEVYVISVTVTRDFAIWTKYYFGNSVTHHEASPRDRDLWCFIPVVHDQNLQLLPLCITIIHDKWGKLYGVERTQRQCVGMSIKDEI